MVGKRKRRRRLRPDDQAKRSTRLKMRPTPPRRRPRHSSPYANTKEWAGIVVATVAGLVFLGIALQMYYDHRILQQRGLVTTGDIVSVSYTKGGYFAEVRFTTADGRTVQADVSSPGDATEVKVGARMEVRYDPKDPTGRVEDPSGDGSSRWMAGIGGVVLLAGAAYGVTRVA
ncbi:DUF3592 domain-containing protein [Dactylosporangium sp. NPDC000521]|uniref:DUF3592 domain-containing protein n=1 Tax=Dactylosporangium sp. NPDC000521 TaxID=3363975 RepID=UPI0036A1EBB7